MNRGAIWPMTERLEREREMQWNSESELIRNANSIIVTLHVGAGESLIVTRP